MTDLTGGIARVSGVSRGIRKAVALALRSRGSDVIRTYLESAEAATALEQENGMIVSVGHMEAS